MFEILLQDPSAEHAAHAIQNLSTQLRSQHKKIYHRGQEYKVSRREQALLHAELQNRERAHQDARIKIIQEVEELNEICCSRADRTQDSRTDSLSRHEESHLGKCLRGSQPTVDQLTVQIQEVQEHINDLNDARHFEHLETVSSSGSFHVPSHPSVVPSFSASLAATPARSLAHGTCVVCKETFLQTLTAPEKPTAPFFRNERESNSDNGRARVTEHGETRCAT